MRRAAALAPALLAACSTAPAEPVVRGETPGHICQTAGTEPFIGMARSARVGDAIKHVSRAAILRWALPGYAITMDYRADRATIWVGPDQKITKIGCN